MRKDARILTEFKGANQADTTGNYVGRKVLSPVQQHHIDTGRAIVDSRGDYHQFGAWRGFEKVDFVVVILIGFALLFLAI